jgi:type III restriction enzyme
MSAVTVNFSLADITETDPFIRLGKRIGADPVGELRRVTLSARTTKGPDGIWRTQMVTAPALDVIESPGILLQLEAARLDLAQRVLAAPAVPARPQERQALVPLLDAFVTGLGDKAEEVLSAYMDRAAAGLINLINSEQRRFAAKPQFDEVTELYRLAPIRFSARETDPDRMGKFKRGAGYEYQKSLYSQDWFDSAPERDVANLLDDDDDIGWWVRLQVGDLPILWAQGREYHPDFIACEKGSDHLVIEVKSDRDMPSGEVQAKREAAKRWANHVSAEESVKQRWRYVLLSERHVATAKGSWPALTALGE